MKITDIKSYLLTAPRDLHLVKIETDSGIHGWGEAGCSTREYAQEGALRHFREFLIGMDPMRIEHIWQILYRSAYYEGGRILTGTIAAVDIALHDIVGKSLGVPVYQLLGGACRDRIYGFATVGGLSDEGCLERTKQLAEEGWPAIRFAPGDPIVPYALRGDIKVDDPTKVFDAWPSVAETAERFAEVLEVLGAPGRGLYLQFQVWDLLNPILIGVAGAMLLGWLLERSQRTDSGWRFVVLLPVAALGADLLENLVISIAVGAFPDLGALGNVLPLVTAAKFGAVMATMVAVVLLVLLWVRDRLSRAAP